MRDPSLDTGAEKYEANATNFAVGAAEAVAGQAPRFPTSTFGLRQTRVARGGGQSCRTGGSVS
jgi:hypothetical protein